MPRWRRKDMKRVLTAMVLAALVLALGGCATIKNVVGGSDGAGAAPANGNNGMPSVTQLLIGTLKLEGSDQPVTAEQAAELLPLWKAYRTLSDSDIASTAEMAALVRQINETMSKEQTQFIKELEVGPDDMATLVRELGVETTGPGTKTRDESQRTGGGGFPGGGGGFPGGGGMPGGGMPGSGGFPGGGMPGAEGADTAKGAPGQGEAGGEMSAFLDPLINALIKSLEAKL
jgi:hypothetical protein